MIMFNLKLKALLLMLITSFYSCSEDKAEYTATFPEFVGFQAKNLVENADLKAGQPFVVSAIEAKQGKHLYQVHYYWTVAPADNSSQRYISSRVYDEKAKEATDTITVQESGNYRITMIATYDVAGIGNGQIPIARRLPNNGGDISYKASTLKYVVTLTKVFRVLD
ncbi:hypothetical protein [Alloprevotella sp. oral taxon 473]|uniref:hypothetical protein n=1 Tax=Alloprevotella sp. oral taxon 473 TaxID=712469 RepID=UPI0002A37AE9|nr:hypothetical protein [Alloprevotella sp. oral taxon 473]EKX88734.1 hypothetical protein HMPREF9999_01776 [Alloprevotella sp. oral taxon 473 str. F0040]